jgi:hypothetical protein
MSSSLSRIEKFDSIINDDPIDKVLEKILTEYRTEYYMEEVDEDIDEPLKKLNSMIDRLQKIFTQNNRLIIMYALKFCEYSEYRTKKFLSNYNTFVNKTTQSKQNDSEETIMKEECPICFEMKDEDPIQLVCKHIFCRSCLIQHITSKMAASCIAQCPMCRANIGLLTKIDEQDELFDLIKMNLDNKIFHMEYERTVYVGPHLYRYRGNGHLSRESRGIILSARPISIESNDTPVSTDSYDITSLMTLIQPENATPATQNTPNITIPTQISTNITIPTQISTNITIPTQISTNITIPTQISTNNNNLTSFHTMMYEMMLDYCTMEITLVDTPNGSRIERNRLYPESDRTEARRNLVLDIDLIVRQTESSNQYEILNRYRNNNYDIVNTIMDLTT